MNHKLILLMPFNFFLCVCVLAQNVGIGTTTPEAKMHIKGAANASQLVIDANGTQSNTNPLIKLRRSNGTDLLWIHSDDSTNTFVGYKTGQINNALGGGVRNTFMGYKAGYSNTTGFGNAANGNKTLYSNTTGSYNTAHGYEALFSNDNADNNTAVGYGAIFFNITGQTNTGIGGQSLFKNVSGNNNTANGGLSLYTNSTGDNNTASGAYSLYYNISGSFNTANGYRALFSNTTGLLNTAHGMNSLFSNGTGNYNTATGNEALFSNTTGSFNIANGNLALYSNITGSQNTSIGVSSLYSTTNSYNNVAVGHGAGAAHDNGWNNVFIGTDADVNGAAYFNVIVIGKSTLVTSSSTARFGNSSTVSYGGWAGWTNVSDGRFKKNIQENVPGIEFITKLRPITYTLDATGLETFYHKNDKSPAGLEGGNNVLQTAANPWQQKAMLEKEKITYTGFIAQEVEAAAKTLGFDFSGVDAAKNENDTYGLRYAEFVVPLVKAVQEQQQMIVELQQLKLKQQLETEELKYINTEQQKIMDALLKRIKKIELILPVQTKL